MYTKQMIINQQSYYWSTDEYMYDNTESCDDLIANELADDIEVVEQNGNQLVVEVDGCEYVINVSGNGDSFNHVAEVMSVCE